MHAIHLKTGIHGTLDITEQIKEYVKKSNVKNGLCCVYNTHSTAGITISCGIDPNVLTDLDEMIKRLVPIRADYHHQCDPYTDAAGHLKSSLIGNSLSFILSDGEIVLGNSQFIYFFEFDGPRDRKVLVEVIGK